VKKPVSVSSRAPDVLANLVTIASTQSYFRSYGKFGFHDKVDSALTILQNSALMKQPRENVGESSTKKDNDKNNTHYDLQEPA